MSRGTWTSPQRTSGLVSELATLVAAGVCRVGVAEAAAVELEAAVVAVGVAVATSAENGDLVPARVTKLVGYDEDEDDETQGEGRNAADEQLVPAATTDRLTGGGLGPVRA